MGFTSEKNHPKQSKSTVAESSLSHVSPVVPVSPVVARHSMHQSFPRAARRAMGAPTTPRQISGATGPRGRYCWHEPAARPRNHWEKEGCFFVPEIVLKKSDLSHVKENQMVLADYTKVVRSCARISIHFFRFNWEPARPTPKSQWLKG